MKIKKIKEPVTTFEVVYAELELLVWSWRGTVLGVKS
jgi:hypothetical protein